MRQDGFLCFLQVWTGFSRQCWGLPGRVTACAFETIKGGHFCLGFMYIHIYIDIDIGIGACTYLLIDKTNVVVSFNRVLIY